MRILVVTHPPLEPRLGAAQLAIALAGALRVRGHDVTLWSTSPPANEPRGASAEARLTDLLRRSERFDVIDIPANSLSPEIAAQTFTVARSFQPEFLYQRADLTAELRRLSPRLPAHLVRAWRTRALLVSGWRHANRILCLGSLECDWMKGRYPAWQGKLRWYRAAPSEEQRTDLLAVRARRSGVDRGGRLLWLGRWAAHKGIAHLRAMVESVPAVRRRGLTLAGCGDAPLGSWPSAWFESGLVELIPTFDRGGLPSLLERHDVGLFTSTAEGWGLSLSEMLESGMTVFATRSGGVPDLQPYFPETLRSLSADADFTARVPEDIVGNGYLETFSWPAVAEYYERHVLAGSP